MGTALLLWSSGTDSAGSRRLLPIEELRATERVSDTRLVRTSPLHPKEKFLPPSRTCGLATFRAYSQPHMVHSFGQHVQQTKIMCTHPRPPSSEEGFAFSSSKSWQQHVWPRSAAAEGHADPSSRMVACSQCNLFALMHVAMGGPHHA